MRNEEREEKRNDKDFLQSSVVICHLYTPSGAHSHSRNLFHNFWFVICHDFADLLGGD